MTVHNHPPNEPPCTERLTTAIRQLRGACLGDPPAPVDAADVFAKLVREVDAGRALIAMTPTGERHRAAVDALALCRDVLTDARDLLDGQAQL